MFSSNIHNPVYSILRISLSGEFLFNSYLAFVYLICSNYLADHSKT